MKPDCRDSIAHLGVASHTLSSGGQMEDALPAVPAVVGGVDFKSNFPLLGHVGQHSQQTILKNLMLALNREGRGPFHHWGLLLCLPQTEKEDEKNRREPRDEEEHPHAEVEHNAHFPSSVQPELLKGFAYLISVTLRETSKK